MARRGRRQVLQLDDVSTSHPSRHRGFGLRQNEDKKQEQLSSNPLLSLVGYSSDASSDEDSDNDKPDRKSPTPDEDHRQENGHKSVIDHDIPLPDEAESSVAQEPIKGTETGKVAEPVASGSVLEIPLPPSSTPAPQGDANFSIDSEVANFLAEIESISAEPTQDNKTDEDSAAAADSSVPAGVDIGFIPRADASQPAEKDSKPAAPVEEKKSKASSTAGAYQSMFVKGASEFVKKDKESDDVKTNGADLEEELPEEPVSPWQMVQDDATQYYYYWNTVSNEVTWEIPPGYTQFLLLYKEYEERIAAIPKDKLQRMKERKEKKKEEENMKRESSPAPSTSQSKREKKHKKDKHRKEKTEVGSSHTTMEIGPQLQHRKEKTEAGSSHTTMEIGPQLPPPEAETDDKDVQPTTHSADEDSEGASKHTGAVLEAIVEESNEVKLPIPYDSAVDSTSMSVPEDVEAIFDDALSAVAKTSGDVRRHAAQSVSSTSSDMATAAPSVDMTTTAASVDISKPSSSVDSVKSGSVTIEGDSSTMVATNTATVSSSSLVSALSVPDMDGEDDGGGESGEGVVTNSGVKDDTAQEEEEEEEDMDFDDIDDLDRALEKALEKKLEKKKAELEKLEEKASEAVAVPDTAPVKTSLADPSPSEASTLTPSSASALEPEPVVSSSVKSTGDLCSAASSSSRSSSSGSDSGEKTKVDNTERRSHRSKSKRPAAESSAEEDGTGKEESTVKKARLVAYDAPETDDENIDPTEEVSTARAQSSGFPADLDNAAAILPTPPPEPVDNLAEIQEMADTAYAKLAFLDITVDGLTPLQTTLIALQTRLSDWQAGGLNGEYFFQRLKEVNDLLKGYESSAVPEGWTCQWDSNFRRYFYVNADTGQAQWEYPDTQAGEVAQVEDRKSRKSKGSKRKRSRPIGPEPLPAHASAKVVSSEDSEAVTSQDVAVAGQEVVNGQEMTNGGQQVSVARQEAEEEEDMDGVAMNEEDIEDRLQELEDVEAKPTASTESDTGEGMMSALQALFPGEPLPPGTELMLGLPPPPPPPLPEEEKPSILGDAYVCGDDSSDDSDNEDEKKTKVEAPSLDPDIDGEEMVEEEEEVAENKEEEEEEEVVAEDPAVISRPPQLRFPAAAVLSSSAIGTSTQTAGAESSSSSVPHVLSAAPVLNTASAQRPTDSSSSIGALPTVSNIGSPKVEEGQRQVGSPSPAQEASSSASDHHRQDKPEKHKKKKKEKLGSHTMSLKKKGVSSLVQKWQKVKKEVEKEERASEQRQQAIRQQLEEWKKENS